MGGEKDNNSKEVVTSVGNAWIICRSKRYSGRIYYFNTLTGKSAWNLSENEMEKVKAGQPEQAVSLNENCPEPQEPPEDPVSQNVLLTDQSTIRPSRIYNKQVINNQITRQLVPQFANTWTNVVNPMNQIAGNQIPGIWAVPPMHQIFITPTMSPMVSQSQSAVHFVTHPTSPPSGLSNPYHNQEYRKNRFKYRGNNKNKKFGYRRGNPYHRRQQMQRMTSDLRNMLIAKRRLQDLCDSRNNSQQAQDVSCASDTAGCSQENTQQNESDVDPLQDLYPSDVDEEWLEEHTHYEGTKPTLDISALSKLASKVGDSEFWYIVVDSSILLNNLDFLNVLLNSDQNCLLIVQQSTMNELRQATEMGATRLKKRARRALCILSQHINSQKAFMDEQNDNKESDHSLQVLSCCIGVSEQKLHVVLLSNDEDILEYKNEVMFPIFSVSEMKKFLEVKHIDDIQVQLPETEVEQMSITVLNDANEDLNIKLSPTETRSEAQCIENYSNNRSVSKYAVDAEVQTDSMNQSPTDLTSPISVTAKNDNQGQQHSEVVNSNCSTSNDCDSNCTLKKREIRLKRIQKQTQRETVQENRSKSPENKEKQFKWHRRRKSKNSCSYLEGNNKQPNDNSESCKSTYSAKDISLTKPIDVNVSGSDIIESSDASSCIISRNHTRDENITIDETSTSVISNSVSNADSESVCSSTQQYNTFSYSSDKLCKNVMFEITSKFMEQHLRRNSEEWMSRFLQIMEDVLSQVLWQDPPFISKELPGPWRIDEAVVCIQRKFGNHPDVVDACEKLSLLLLNQSDHRGKIHKNMLPVKFMEMYSYGVYLLDTLMNVRDCEDLQTAAESLSKLLTDIQNPRFYALNTDNAEELPSRPDTPVASTHNMDKNKDETELLKSPLKKITIVNSSPKNVTPSPEDSKKRYGLRSNKKKEKEEQSKQQEVQVVRKLDPQSAFFTSLNLQKNKSSKNIFDENSNSQDKTGEQKQDRINLRKEDDATHGQDKCAPKIIRNFTPCLESAKKPFSKNSKSEEKAVERKQDSVNLRKEDDAKQDQDKCAPKIIRNFTPCLEFEQRLKNKTRPQLDLDELDYMENFAEEAIEDEENYDFEDDECEDYFDNDPHRPEDNSESHASFQKNGIDNDESLSSDMTDHDEFKWLIAAIWCQIKLVLSQVHSFCENTIQYLQEMREGDQSTLLNNSDIRNNADKAQEELGNLCKALQSSKSDDNLSGTSIHNTLKYFGIDINDDVILNDEQLKKYSEMVSKCTDQADILMKSIGHIINAINK